VEREGGRGATFVEGGDAALCGKGRFVRHREDQAAVVVLGQLCTRGARADRRSDKARQQT